MPVPVPIYIDKTQVKFISQTNSSVGHFDGITPDIYVQFDERSLGWIRINIPQIVKISVDPASKEAPVTVKTTAGRVYKGTCHDPFNFSGSVFSFSNAKKSLTLLRKIPDSPGIENPANTTLNGVQPESAEPGGAKPGIESSWFMKSTVGPGMRSGFVMAYDEKQEVIILQGGTGPGNAGNHPSGMPGSFFPSPDHHDTWSWNGSSWRLLSDEAPGFVNHALAYSKKPQHMVISGGNAGSGRTRETFILKDEKWVKSDDKSLSGVEGIESHAMAYDEKRKTIVLFGGMTVRFPGSQIALGDTWEWDGSAWSRLNVNGPEPRWGHKMVYDQSTGIILLFGGYDGKRYFDDTWIWNGNTARWSKVAPGTSPSARCHHGLTCDTARGTVLMFGGLSATKTPLNDLWEWNGSKWTLLMAETPPKPRYDHGFAYDPGRNKSLLYGGFDGKEFFQDSWEFTF